MWAGDASNLCKQGVGNARARPNAKKHGPNCLSSKVQGFRSSSLSTVRIAATASMSALGPSRAIGYADHGPNATYRKLIMPRG